jgi:hypothetical protein
MAAGSEVPQKGVLQATGYQPVETRLNPPMQLPGTGELWANVGKTAMNAVQQAGQMLQASPLNPVVKEQMTESIARSKLGEAAMAHAMANPNWAYGTTAESPSGASMTAPITQPVAQQVGQGIDYSGQSKKEEQPKPKEEQPKPKVTPPPPANLNSGMTQATPAVQSDLTAALASTLVPSQGGSTAAATAGDGGMPNTGQPQSSDIVATPAAPPGGSIWSPMRPAPAAPPAPNQPPPQPAAQSQTPAAATQGDQAAMAKWQAQNAHPVMSSQDALGWMKNQTTLAQDATYLPMGGPDGSPAYAFHMKGGGQNIVPVSQMIQKGAGPMVAAQNTSAVLSATDQQAQQQQNAPNLSPPPPANLPQYANISGPPPAPTGPQVAQGQLPAPQDQTQPPAAPGAYNAAAYQMPQGPTVSQNGQVNPALMAGGDNQQAQQAAREAGKANASPQQLEADANLPPANRIYDWQTETDDQGKVHQFTEFPDTEGRPFVTRRYYKGDLTGFQPGAYGTENREKEQIYDEMVGTKGVPIPKDENGQPIKFDASTIAAFSPEQRNVWLKYIRDYNLHPNAPLATSSEGINLSNAANAVKDATRIRDKILYLQAHNIPMSTISQAEIIRSQEAGYSAASTNPVEKALWNAVSGGFPGGEAQPQNNFVDELNGDYEKLNDHLAHVQGGTYEHTAGTPKGEVWGIPATDWTPAGGIPKTTNVSKIPALNRIGSGDTYEQAIAHVQEVLDNAKKDYKNAADKLYPANFRPPDVDLKNLSDLADPKKGYIDDPTNKMWDAKHQKMVNPYGAIPNRPNPLLSHWDMLGDDGKPQQPTASTTPGQPGAKASPTPVSREIYDAAPHPKTVDDFNKIPKGTWYVDGDGQYKPKK